MSSPRPREDARRRQERPHVLIISDDQSLSTFLGEGLVMGGFWTSVISHGLQVLEVFRLRQFDLVVLDFELGNFDALELLHRLRGVSVEPSESTPRTNAPVVIMSSVNVPLSHHERQTLGIPAVLQAPVELEEVVKTLHRAFSTWREDHPDALLADESPDG